MLNRVIRLTARQRKVLHHLLHRNLRKCSSAALDSFVRQGWTSGMAGGFQLTDAGRRLAELSEQAISEGALEVQPQTLYEAVVEANPHSSDGARWVAGRYV